MLSQVPLTDEIVCFKLRFVFINSFFLFLFHGYFSVASLFALFLKPDLKRWSVTFGCGRLVTSETLAKK